MVIKVLMVRNTLDWRSSGISLRTQRELVRLLNMYKIIIAKIKKNEINILSFPSSPI